MWLTSPWRDHRAPGSRRRRDRGAAVSRGAASERGSCAPLGRRRPQRWRGVTLGGPLRRTSPRTATALASSSNSPSPGRRRTRSSSRAAGRTLGWSSATPPPPETPISVLSATSADRRAGRQVVARTDAPRDIFTFRPSTAPSTSSSMTISNASLLGCAYTPDGKLCGPPCQSPRQQTVGRLRPDGLFGAPVGRVDRRVPKESEHRGEFDCNRVVMRLSDWKRPYMATRRSSRPRPAARRRLPLGSRCRPARSGQPRQVSGTARPRGSGKMKRDPVAT